MKKNILVFLCLTLLGALSLAQVRVVTTYPYIADLVQRIGGNNVQVSALARGDYNPHVILPKPSYIAKLRTADLLIINGAQLEIGWLPPILKQANNGTIQPGEKGFLDLSLSVTLIEKPSSVSREMGDVHPDGNPHFYLDPENIPAIASAIAGKLSELDPQRRDSYENNRKVFQTLWEAKLKEWENLMKPLQGARVVEYHKIFDYFLKRYSLQLVGTVEPLPGIPPTSKHIEALEQVVRNESVRYLFHDVYNPKDASEYLRKKTGVQLIVLPHDVGATAEATDIVTLFDIIVRRIAQ